MKLKDIGNIQWQQIPRGWLVKDTGASFIAIDTKARTFKLCNWGSQDADNAQQYLRDKARKDLSKLQQKNLV